MVTASFTISAIPPVYLDRIRAQGEDDFGNPIAAFTNRDEGGTPLRCCLREAAPGERVVLMAYRPAARGGTYAEVGPLFVHADRCTGYLDETAYPEGFRSRRQLFRAYDAEGLPTSSQIVEPDEVDAVIAELLARTEVDVIHSRNVLAGCYMFAVNRIQDGRS